MMAQVRMLDGWGAIAAVLTGCAGVEVSKAQARRYADRTENALPVRRMGRLQRKRVVAAEQRVVAWAIKEFE